MVHFAYHQDYAPGLLQHQPAPLELSRICSRCQYTMRLRIDPMYLSQGFEYVQNNDEGDCGNVILNMVMHAKVFAVAIKYQFPSLETIAIEKFRDTIIWNWNHDTFAEAISSVYHRTSDQETGLREIVAETLANENGILDEPDIEAVVKEIPDLAYQVLRKVRKKTNLRNPLYRSSNKWNMQRPGLPPLYANASFAYRD
ncbi:hypothetical protein K470DRAFT_90272 [Piedraia hortae CBS 480.64]|uniref:Uncharacterized protein n=1 Tax=Piedraia hortae CBS 480.64 TaxID=1314780 RepID=A0A6A7BX78_9PEZI|nr:hypothetical protein K470DRAFT_90272 [Piedraia hortae CBS 480.64]